MGRSGGRVGEEKRGGEREWREGGRKGRGEKEGRGEEGVRERGREKAKGSLSCQTKQLLPSTLTSFWRSVFAASEAAKSSLFFCISELCLLLMAAMASWLSASFSASKACILKGEGEEGEGRRQGRERQGGLKGREGGGVGKGGRKGGEGEERGREGGRREKGREREGERVVTTQSSAYTY